MTPVPQGNGARLNALHAETPLHICLDDGVDSGEVAEVDLQMVVHLAEMTVGIVPTMMTTARAAMMTVWTVRHANAITVPRAAWPPVAPVIYPNGTLATYRNMYPSLG